MKLPTYFHLVRRLRMSGAISPPPITLLCVHRHKFPFTLKQRIIMEVVFVVHCHCQVCFDGFCTVSQWFALPTFQRNLPQQSSDSKWIWMESIYYVNETGGPSDPQEASRGKWLVWANTCSQKGKWQERAFPGPQISWYRNYMLAVCRFPPRKSCSTFSAVGRVTCGMAGTKWR
jgi:hypothetical protein